MNIKRYIDQDMRHVLRRVRESQGPEAVILSNRRTGDGIEVIAAIDYDETLAREALGMDPATDAALSSDELAEIAEPDAPPQEIADTPKAKCLSANLVAGPVNDESLIGVKEEISSLRGLVETQLSGLVWKDTARRSPIRAQVLRNLARIGLAPDIANNVIDRLEPIEDVRNMWHAPLSTLAQMISTQSSDMLENGGRFALIGPTGVGKTTTIAKIAARYAIQNWPDEIALISADSFRIGAREHLQAFANIIGVPVHAASNADEIGELLDRLSDKKLVLIDTEGRSPRDRDLSDQLVAFGDHQSRVKFFLTLSATTQEAGLNEAVREFSTVPLEGCIVTKVDEAAQLGCVLSTLIRNDLRASWITDGQQIPDDLHIAEYKKLWLVNRAVECMENSMPHVDERLMAERYTPMSVSHA
ncbi:MAG: flagellar biosynthesis protein FlhF [Pseudomonadota bacterium]